MSRSSERSAERAWRLLVVDDHASIRELLATWARERGHDARAAADAQEALGELQRHHYDLVIADMRMPGLTGLELLQQLPSDPRPPAVVLITAFGSVPEAVQAFHAGALDYVTKPFNVEDLFRRIESRLGKSAGAAASLVPAVVSALVDASGRSRAPAVPTPRLAPGSGVLRGAPDNLRLLYELLDQVAPSRCTVFISGPSGVGKELVAAELHARSPRAHRAFVRVNCPAIPKELQESELFGHEKGAFTGAMRRQEGKFFHANGGTILLDEISETSLAFQSKLLRVLQEREYERVGGNEIIRLDVRLLATTNRNMADLVAKGLFREDLFYRLNVVPIEISPLRQRREDIPFLVRHFIDRFCEENRRSPLLLTSEALDALLQRAWAGNVRQLQNVCERAVVLKRGGDTLELRDFCLDLEIDTPRAQAAETTLCGMERDLILRTLQTTRANRTEAARRLGISVRTLRNKLNEYRAQGIDVESVLEAASTTGGSA